MAEPGMAAVEKWLPILRKNRTIDMVVVQAENVSGGKGMRPDDYERLRRAGIDVCTGGNHTPALAELTPLLEDMQVPVIGPANMHDCPGTGYVYVRIGNKRVLVVSLLGHIVGRHADLPTDNPLTTIDTILAQEDPAERDVLVVNFHGDYSSEKVIIGHYLDGRASIVVGDHWHVPTADATVLPKGTAHITDVGMCGSLDSSLGVAFSSVLPRWRDGVQTRNELELGGRMQFNALFVSLDETTGKATSAEHIREVW